MNTPNITNRLYLETLAGNLENELLNLTKEHEARAAAYRDKYKALETVVISIIVQLHADDKRITKKKDPGS